MTNNKETKLMHAHELYVKDLEAFRCPICHEIGNINDEKCTKCGEDFSKYILHINKQETIDIETAKVLIIDEPIETFRAFKYVSNPSSVEKIILPDSVRKVASHAFSFYRNIRTYFIPRNVQDIHPMAFVFQTGISSFDSYFVQEGIEVDPLNQTFDSRDGCHGLIRTKDNLYMRGFNFSYIPDGIEILANRCFWRTTREISSVDIPNSVKRIGSYAFYDSNIQSLFLPKSLETLDLTIIPNSLKTLIIPASVKRLDGYLNEDSSLNTEFYYEGEWIPEQFEKYIKGLRFYTYSKRMDSDGRHWHYVNDVPTLYQPYLLSDRKNQITILNFTLIFETGTLSINRTFIKKLMFSGIRETAHFRPCLYDLTGSIIKVVDEFSIVIDKRAFIDIDPKIDEVSYPSFEQYLKKFGDLIAFTIVGTNNDGTSRSEQYYVAYEEDENDKGSNIYQEFYQDDRNIYITVIKDKKEAR